MKSAWQEVNLHPCYSRGHPAAGGKTKDKLLCFLYIPPLWKQRKTIPKNFLLKFKYDCMDSDEMFYFQNHLSEFVWSEFPSMKPPEGSFKFCN